jgi:methionine-rich copper-binding protein CopC
MPCPASRLPLLLLLAAAPCLAHAHAILVDSTPAPNAHLQAGPLGVKFRYNSRIDTTRSKLTLTGPDGTETRLAIHDGDMPATLSAVASVGPGAYTLRWQVLAIDGHITRGTVPFSVDGPAK